MAPPLVQDGSKADALGLEILHRQHHAVAADLLIVGGADVQIHPIKAVFLPQQLLAGLQLGEEGGLGVHSTPAEEGAVLLHSAEGVRFPALSPLHHIVVGHEHNIFRGIPPPDHIDEAAAAEGQPLRPGRQQGEALRQHLVKPVKLTLVGKVPGEHRFAVHHPLQGLGIGGALLRRNIFSLRLRG